MYSAALVILTVLYLILLFQTLHGVPLRGDDGASADQNKSKSNLNPILKSKHRSEQQIQADSKYERYAQELINSLGTDEELKKKLGVNGVGSLPDAKLFQKLAQESPDIRTKLDELKRNFVEQQRVDQRMKQLNKNGIPNDLDVNSMKEYQRHIKESLPKNNRMKAIDEMRKKAFVRAEMKQKLKEREKFRDLDESERINAENNFRQHNRVKEKSKINHPGSLNQLEEVWSAQDGFEKSEFNARTFFLLHDKNGDKILDIFEVEALFVNEVKKVYNSDGEDDNDNAVKKELNFEMLEEISRMREHFFEEYDENRDDSISLSEFLKHTNSEKFRKDDGWQTLDEYNLYSPDDLANFEKEYNSDQDDDDYDYLYDNDDDDDHSK